MTTEPTIEQLLDDARGGYRVASASADRFRDVITQALGLPENPGDDGLVSQLLAAHGMAGALESTRWRDFCDTARMELGVAGFRFSDEMPPPAAEPAPVQGAGPTGPQTDTDGELALLREDNEMADVMLRIARRNVNRWEQKHNTQRERADKAEAERDQLIERLCALIPDDEGDDAAVEHVIVEWVKRQRTQRDQAVALLTEICAAIPEVEEKISDGLYARLAELRAGTEEAQS